MSERQRDRDDSALVFKLRSREPASLSLERGVDVNAFPGLRAVLAYLSEHERSTARLEPLLEVDPDEGVSGSNWHVALPPGNTGALRGVHHLQLADAADGEPLRRALEGDREGVEYVHAPVIFRTDPPMGATRTASPEPLDWSLRHCGFPAVWPSLDAEDTDHPIVMIDQGEVGLDHDDLAGRIISVHRPSSSERVSRRHAAGVASILSARRTPDACGGTLNGCCSASLIIHDCAKRFTATNGGFDYVGFQRALEDARTARHLVVNISMSGMEIDCTTKQNLAAAMGDGVALVASVGNDGFDRSVPTYPAGFDDVIAVGALGVDGRHFAPSNRGGHVLLAAPGERMRGVTSRHSCHDELSGTSYAAPMVSAAVWMMRRHQGLSVGDVRRILRESANADAGNPAGGRDDYVGYGRLDMPAIAAALGIPCPDRSSGAHFAAASAS